MICTKSLIRALWWWRKQIQLPSLAMRLDLNLMLGKSIFTIAYKQESLLILAFTSLKGDQGSCIQFISFFLYSFCAWLDIRYSLSGKSWHLSDCLVYQISEATVAMLFLFSILLIVRIVTLYLTRWPEVKLPVLILEDCGSKVRILSLYEIPGLGNQICCHRALNLKCQCQVHCATYLLPKSAASEYEVIPLLWKFFLFRNNFVRFCKVLNFHAWIKSTHICNLTRTAKKFIFRHISLDADL